MKTNLIIFITAVSALQAETATLKQQKIEKGQNWWKTATFYQVYPRSFKDSDNDGSGDLRGITSKIGHFVDLGVQAIWLSPIYPSPQVDGGYDISDYRSIDPMYGSLEDFKELLAKAHEHGLKVVLDFVPNHTSDLHEWFKKSVNREKEYEDYYVWADGKVDENGTRTPPNTWNSVWGGSIWTWNEKRGQYFLHQFSDKQPDLNFRNENVQKEMKGILDFWLDIGVDGFRIDAVPHLVEDDQLRDEPRNSGVSDPNDYNYYNHIYTKDQPLAYEIIYNWRSHLDNYTQQHGGDTRVIMSESATDLEHLVRYYGSKDGQKIGVHFSFNFYFIGFTEREGPQDILRVLNEWKAALPKSYTMNWLLGNHDNPRVATRVGQRNVDGYNMLVSFLPGVSITYMGEEIGQENGEVTCKEGQDPSAKNCSTFDKTSRDFERTPYQWDNSTNAGFNEGAKTWLPVGKKYKVTNLAAQQNDQRSHYNVYKKLMELRQEWKDNLSTNIISLDDDHPRLLMVGKLAKGSEIPLAYFLAFNMYDHTVQVDFKETIYKEIPLRQLPQVTFEVVLSSGECALKPGDKIEDPFGLQPGDAVIVQTNWFDKI